MNQVLKSKTILIVSIVVFGAGFLFVLPANATALSLTVEWSETGSSWLPLSGPIFSETNILPGQDVIRLVRVTNNSGQTQRIAAEAINESNSDNFASQLNLTIREGPTIIYNNTLANFFSQGETYLSDLANGNTTQYDFTIAFNSGSGNEYQEKALSFDILIGFQGTEGGLPAPSPGDGNDSGLPSGLTIQDESVQITEVGETSITLIWTTSYFSTSQVVYAKEGENHTLDLADTSGVPPKYGYSRTTPEYDTSSKVMAHSMTITGLTSETTYYFRAISHGSLAISREYSFFTLVGVPQISEKPLAQFSPLGELPNFGRKSPGLAGSLVQGTAPSEGQEASSSVQEKLPALGTSEQSDVSLEKSSLSLFASLASLFSSGWSWLIIILLLIFVWLYWQRQKERKRKKNQGF